MEQLFPEGKVQQDLRPKFGAGQYGTEISSLLSKPASLTHSSLWGGDLQSFMLQAGPRGLMRRTQLVLSAGDHVLPSLGDKMRVWAGVTGARVEPLLADLPVELGEGVEQFGAPAGFVAREDLQGQLLQRLVELDQ